jgi:hypothetical protein
LRELGGERQAIHGWNKGNKTSIEKSKYWYLIALLFIVFGNLIFFIFYLNFNFIFIFNFLIAIF